MELLVHFCSALNESAHLICILSSEVASCKECYAVCEESRNRGRAYPSDSDSLEYAEVYALYTVYKARDGFRLVAGGLIIGYQLKISHSDPPSQ